MARRRYLRAPGSESAGYHYNAVPKHPAPTKTPVIAPPPSEAATQPAGDYAGAAQAFHTAVQRLPKPARVVTQRAIAERAVPVPSLLSQVGNLLTPGTSPREVAEAAHRLGVQPQTSEPVKTPDIVNTALSAVDKGAQEIGHDVATVAKLPQERVHASFGHPTLGTPTAEQVIRAAEKGKAQLNQRGKLTIPATRHAARQLAHAKQEVAQTTGVSGPLTPGQKVFVQHYAKLTGLNPRVVAAQALAEESGSAAQQREAEGNHDWLNIGYSDSGPQAITKQAVWSNPVSAARAAAAFTKGEFGGASPGIQRILASAGSSPQQQINAIGNSGWATSNYGSEIRATLPEVSDRANPKALANLQQAKEGAQKLGIGIKPSVGPVPKAVLTRYQAGVHAENQLEKMHLPYVWGGGHTPGKVQPGSGLDCSGTVSLVLQHMGVKLPGGIVSGEMGNYLPSGPGVVTVFYNSEHTFMYDARSGKYFGTSSTNPSGGAGYFSKAVGNSEVASGNSAGAYQVAHVPGLGQKAARQMGIALSAATPAGGSSGASGPFPGMTLSADGSSAQVAPGAATKKQTPGFSSSPILADPVPVSPLLATQSLAPHVGEQEPLSAQEEPEGLIAQILRRRRA